MTTQDCRSGTLAMFKRNEGREEARNVVEREKEKEREREREKEKKEREEEIEYIILDSYAFNTKKQTIIRYNKT